MFYAACGQGEQSGEQKHPYFGGVSDLREDTKIKYPFAELQFSYLGMQGTPSKPSYMIQTASATPSSKFWNLELQIKYHEQAFQACCASHTLPVQPSSRAEQSACHHMTERLFLSCEVCPKTDYPVAGKRNDSRIRP